jgi:hypothetical protein
VALFRRAASVLVLSAFATAHAVVCAADAPKEEMACCRDGHKVCGTMTSASDCCQSRAQNPDRVTPAKPPDAVPAAVPVAIAWWLELRAGGQIPATPTGASSKRPHDPPHLHTFALLI